MTKGVVLYAWGKRGYGFAAHNLALSIKSTSPGLEITLYTDRNALKQVTDLSVFDHINYLDNEDLSSPADIKTNMYHNLPYDATLFLDVDALILQDINPLFDELIARGGNYYTYIYDWYDHTSPDDMPMMFWAKRSTIWRTYGFDDNTKFPATQSSIQFMRRSEEVNKLGTQIKNNLASPIPLLELSQRWGGTQPDELYLNITLAQLGYGKEVHIGDQSIFFGYETSQLFHQVKEKYYVLSIFGGRGHTKSPYLRGYDGLMKNYAASLGRKHHYLVEYIIDDKHANNKKVTNKREQRAQQQRLKNPNSIPTPSYSVGKEKIVLGTPYFDAGNLNRQKELDFCLERNLLNKHISRVVVFAETEIPDNFLNNPKLSIVNMQERTSMGYIMRHLDDSPEEIKIMANSDIFFKEEIGLVWEIDFSGKSLCLSRWDWYNDGRAPRLFNYDYSQDSWIWKDRSRGTAEDMMHIPFGKPGCDNKLAHHLGDNGLTPCNPSMQLKSYHVHNTNLRTYKESQRIPQPYRNVPVDTIEKLIKPSLLIRQNGKVGDVIIVMPIAKWYSERGYKVYWEIEEKYHGMMGRIPYVTAITTPNRKYEKTIDLNFGLEPHNPVHTEWLRKRKDLDSFVSLKYQIAEVPISELQKLDYERNLDKENDLYNLIKPDLPYCLFHGNSDYGTGIHLDRDNVVNFSPYEGYEIFDWLKIIENASEIHGIDSSLVNFVDRVKTDAELNYYITDKVPNKWDRTILHKNWKSINK